MPSHKKNLNKKLIITIIPENGKVINLSLSYKLLKLLGILLGCITIGIIYLIFIYGRVYLIALKANMLEKENNRLQAEVQKMDEIKEKIESINKIYKKLTSLLEIEKSYNPNSYKTNLEKETLTQEKFSENDMNKYIPDIYPVAGWISRKFDQNHLGIDVSAKEGTPIFSPIFGVVKDAKYDSYFGNMIKIVNDAEFEVILCHNKENLVNIGDTVEKGQIVGYVGNTGKSSSAHLHYQIIFQEKYVDPLNYLPRR